ncbi:MAG: ABC transporter permease [Candidatus Bathyarchaeota archaeon]|jgi:peptide/nickel transport system permease protein|nr:ABC transporter permease [Candidatus Bathyarchaeota archaeon]
MTKNKTQNELADELKQGAQAHRRRELEFMWYRIRSSPLSLAGLTLILFFIILGISAPLIIPVNPVHPYKMPKTFSRLPLPPSREHPFGTTGPVTYGDIFYGVIWGTRYSLMLAFAITGICLPVGLTIGTIAGYYGGKLDEVLMRIVDLVYSLPWLLMMLVILIAIGQRGFWTMVISYSILAWPGYARMIRGEILRVKNELFVEAAKAIGLSDLTIMTKHVIPNAIYTVVIMAAARMGTIVLSTASLGFLGLGFNPGTAEWGIIISEGRNWLLQGSWWITAFPGIFIFFFVLGWQLMGDAFRDILDPKVRRSI